MLPEAVSVHDLQLVIDGDMSKTYVLNSNFTYDFGTYTSGSTYYSIPQLEPGKHELTFRAWDIQNNSSTVKLRFQCGEGTESGALRCGRNRQSG